MTHTLKTWPEYWDAVDCGDKTFEVRRDDRNFKVGDTVQLIRWDKAILPANDGHYCCTRRIVYILHGDRFGIEPGYVVMGLGGA
jgi:hypothetical protein